MHFKSIQCYPVQRYLSYIVQKVNELNLLKMTKIGRVFFFSELTL